MKMFQAKLNKKSVASFLLLLTICALESKAWAQMVNWTSASKVITVTTTGSAGRDTAYFANPPALGYSSVAPSLSSINPPDAVYFDGISSYVVKQLTGALADSIKLYEKPINFDGAIVIGDSAFVLGAAGSFYTFVGTVGSSYGDSDAGAVQARLGGVAIYLVVGDLVSATRTFSIQRTSGGIYDVRSR